MNRFKRRALILGMLATAVIAVGMMGPANAGWVGCPPGTHVAYNPVTGGSMQVGHDVRLGSTPTTLAFALVCVDDGGLTGANTVATAGYHWADTTGGGYAQHVVVCPNVPASFCEDVWAGAAVGAVAAGPGGGGATICGAAFTDVSYECEDVRASVGSTLPGSTATANPGSGLCGVSVSGTCTLKEATVTAGGTTVGATGSGTVPVSESATVPQVSVCVNKGGVSNPVQIEIAPASC